MAVWVPTPGSHSASAYPLICFREISMQYCTVHSDHASSKNTLKNKNRAMMNNLIQNKLWHSAAMGGYNKTYIQKQCPGTPLPGRKNKSKSQILKLSWLVYMDWQVANNSVKWLLALTGCLPWTRKEPAVLPDGGARGSLILRHVRFLHRCWGPAGSWFSSKAGDSLREGHLTCAIAG